jgi:hypothetical protein
MWGGDISSYTDLPEDEGSTDLRTKQTNKQTNKPFKILIFLYVISVSSGADVRLLRRPTVRMGFLKNLG